MPVRFEGTSEYQRKFAWLPSSKSASFYPAEEQASEPAGVSSSKLAKTNDPPLQHKKRVDLFPVSSANEPAPQDEYILLGDQQKFAPSVKYSWKKMNSHTRSKEDRAVDTSNGVTNGYINGYQPKATTPPKKKNKAVEAVYGHENGTEKTLRSPPPAPRPDEVVIKAKKSKSAPVVTMASKNDRRAKAEKLIPQPSNEAPAKGKKSPHDLKHKRSGTMHEFAQTNLDQGIGYSAPEAPADYAMKYRAGIAPPRPKGPKRLSEYQLQYKWKEGANSSPLLAAEQVVYKSSSMIGPHKKDDIPKFSEYKAQFQPWNRVAKSMALPDSEFTPRDKQKLKRSKSAEGLDKMPAAGVYRQTSEEDKRLVKESLNPLRIHFPHGKHRRYKSEYELNFKPPQDFEYLDGAWKGANPPHVEAKDGESKSAADNQNLNATQETADISRSAASWFSEVVELRNRAEEYKRRAQGTHFSRQHTGQLYAKQAEMWDTVSTVSALSLESSIVQHNQSKKSPPRSPSSVSVLSKASSNRMENPREKVKLAWEEESASTVSGVAQANGYRPPSTSVASQSGSDIERSSNVTTTVESEEGRLPTPELATLPAQRHHLDRTTPAVGGAILVAPGNTPPKKGKRRREGHSNSSPSHTITHQPIAGQQVRCTCGADDDLEDDLDLSPSSSPLSPAHNTSGHELRNVGAPVLKAEKLLKEKVERKAHVAEKAQNFYMQSKSDTFVPVLRAQKQQDSSNNNNLLLEAQYAPDIQLKYKDSSAQTSQPATTRKHIPHESKTPFVPGFQTMGRNYNMPEYLIRWQAEQFQRSERRRRRELAQDGLLDEAVNDVPVYLSKQPEKVPMPGLRTKSTQFKPSDTDQIEDRGLRTVSSYKAKATGTEKVHSKPVNVGQVYGMPTRDTHVLMDEGASTDRTLPTNYVHSPVRDRAALKEQLGIPSTIPESLTASFNRPPVDDDAMSMISQASFASSCSMASEVLERARMRKDKFWGNKPSRA